MRPDSDLNAHKWPGYLLGGRIRTSTVVLLLVFIGVWWLYETAEPPEVTPEQVPASEVVPPGFIPDPAYTWVPRTDVQRDTSSTSPTTTTSPAAPSVSGAPSTTADDQDDAGPSPGATTGAAVPTPTGSAAPSPSLPTPTPSPAP